MGDLRRVRDRAGNRRLPLARGTRIIDIFFIPLPLPPSRSPSRCRAANPLGREDSLSAGDLSAFFSRFSLNSGPMRGLRARAGSTRKDDHRVVA